MTTMSAEIVHISIAKNWHDADSALKPAAIPIINRPPFRFEAGHHSNQ